MPKASHQPRSLLIVMVILSMGFLSSAAPSWSQGNEPEASRAADSLLKYINTMTEKKLLETPGLNPDTVKKVMAHRASGVGFKSLAEFIDSCGVSRSDFETLLKPYQDVEAQRLRESSRKEIPDPATNVTKAKAGKLQKNEATSPGSAGAAPPGESGAGPIGMVKPGYYSKLPGYEDLEKIDPLKKTEFLETVNREMCSCGCKSHTVAFCLVNDPGCPVVKARTKKIYDDIMTKAPR